MEKSGIDTLHNAGPEGDSKVYNKHTFLSGFDLPDSGKRSLHVTLCQREMSDCGSLYQETRVHLQLSNTCSLLRDHLIPIIGEFRNQLPARDLSFREEVLEFGFFLMKKINRGIIKIPYLKEVLKLELAMNELSDLPEGEFRLLNFGHDIFQILRSLRAGTLHSDVIEKSKDVYKMYVQNMEIRMDIL